MAQQNINLGAAANDGTGEGLRDGGLKIQSNFTELYQVTGWGYYQDSQTAPATQSISVTPSILQIDGAGASSESGYLPHEIRGISELWDVTNDKFTPITIGDGYDVRISLEITAKGASPNVIEIVLDVGGGPAITIPIVELQIPVVSIVPFNVTASIPVFCLSTFLTNGGKIFLSTDAGTLTVGARNIFIKRDFKGTI